MPAHSISCKPPWLDGYRMQFDQLRRREFITLLGGVAVAWPVPARAQRPERGQLRATAFRQGLQKLGWVVGRNVQIDFQWGLGDADWIRSGRRARAATGAGPDRL